jgi:preprotein translocase subunit SecD
MTTMRELLRDADPLAHEPARTDYERQQSRELVLARADGPREIPRRRAMRTIFVAAAVVAVAAAGLYWSRASVDVVAAVRFEVRLAEESFSPGLREAAVNGGRKIYLHQESVVTNSDIAQAQLVEGDGSRYSVSIVFKPEGAARIGRATGDHVGRPVAILIDGIVVMAPTVRAPIGAEALISGDYSKADAERIVNGLIGR